MRAPQRTLRALAAATLAIFIALPARAAHADRENLRAGYTFLVALEKRMFAGEWTTRQTRSAFRSAYLSRFARLQDDGSLRALRNDDVRTLFDATSLASFYAGDYRMTRDLERDLEELRRRHLARTQDAVDVYESLIDDRRFTDARVFMLCRMPAGGVQPPRVVETRAYPARPDGSLRRRYGAGALPARTVAFRRDHRRRRVSALSLLPKCRVGDRRTSVAPGGFRAKGHLDRRAGPRNTVCCRPRLESEPSARANGLRIRSRRVADDR